MNAHPKTRLTPAKRAAPPGKNNPQSAQHPRYVSSSQQPRPTPTQARNEAPKHLALTIGTLLSSQRTKATFRTDPAGPSGLIPSLHLQPYQIRFAFPLSVSG